MANMLANSCICIHQFCASEALPSEFEPVNIDLDWLVWFEGHLEASVLNWGCFVTS